MGALLLALGAAGPGGRTTLAVVSDLRTGLAGSAEERDSGDGAAAILCAPDGAVAELIGRGAASDEFLDRWRVPGEADSHVWEERFGEEMYVPLAREAFAAALKDAGLAEGDVDHAIVTGLHVRAVKAITKGLGVRDGALAPDLTGSVGNLGAAQAAVALCDVLERAQPGQVIVVLSLADGADALVLRTTEALTAAQAARAEAGVPSVAEQVAAGRDDLLVRDLPDLAGPDAPRAATTSRPRAPGRADGAPLRGVEVRLRRQPLPGLRLPPHAARPGPACRVTPSTRCSPSAWRTCRGRWPPSPSTTWPSACRHRWSGVIVDFDGGGRYRCEMTDVVASELSIGDRVSMTFRRVWTAQGVHNYFWKARPAVERAADTRARSVRRWAAGASATRWPSSAWAALVSASCGTRGSTTS